MSDDGKERGILVKMLTNKDIQKGIAFFSVALILAFSAILPVAEEEVDTGTVDTIEDDEDPQPEYVSIYYPGYQVTNATLELDIDSIGEEGNDNATSRIGILDHQFDILHEENITSEESRTWEITEKNLGRAPSRIYFENISLSYTYTLNYERRPYGLLSLPAIFLTLIGMIFAFRGKAVILGEIKQKQMEEEAKKEQEEREDRSDEEDKSESTLEEEVEKEEEVIYSGEDGTEEKGDAEHVNFMGILEEDEEEDGSED